MSSHAVGPKPRELSDNSVNFLLAEFQASIDQWQHMHDRLDREVQYYFTLFGALIAAGGLILRFGEASVVETLGLVHLLVFVIGVAGYRLLRRISHLTYVMALLNAQVGLIRRSFIHLEESVASYLILTTASTHSTAHDFPPVSKALSVKLVLLANSLLAALSFFLTPFYFYFTLGGAHATRSWITIFIAVGVVSLVVGIFFFLHQRKTIVLKNDQDMEEVTRKVQHRLRTEPQAER